MPTSPPAGKAWATVSEVQAVVLLIYGYVEEAYGEVVHIERYAYILPAEHLLPLLSRLVRGVYASHNYGASKPSEAGTYVAWGEELEKEEYNQSNYTHYKDGAFTDFDKSLTDSGIDVVANNWGGKWHTPTYAELEELRTGCNWTWTSKKNGEGADIYGYLVTSKTNGNSIFLPATGEKYQTTKYFEDYGRYWSSEQYVGTDE